jgi:type II secretory pathway pseudopilin PulG
MGHRNRNQRGYVLLAILFALTLLIVGLAAAAPRVTTAIKRQKEEELIRRGNQYALAIRRFYKKFGRYPANVDQLQNTNDIRFLRRKYLDPLTGKDDWTPIQYGQARPSLGFFGQKLVTVGGQSPAGAGIGTSSINGPSGGPLSNSSGTSSATVGGIGVGTNSSSTSNSPFSSGPGSSPLSGSTGTSSSPFSSATGSNSPFSNGPGASNSPTGAPAGPAGTAGNPISTDQLSQTTFGGGAIVGFSVPSQKQSLKEYQGKDHYNEWQFVYDPTVDASLRGGGIGGAGAIPGNTPAGSPGLNLPGANPMSPGNPTTPTGPSGTTPQSPQ